MNIDFYYFPTCPFCIRAGDLLEKTKGVALNRINIHEHPDQKQVMVDRSGGRTSVPQIFINDTHVGGCDDLFALHTSGELDKLLNNA